MTKYVLIRAVGMFFEVLVTLIVLNAILSWFARPGTGVYRIYARLGQITEPIVAPFRRVTANFAMRSGVDFAPILAIVVLQFLSSMLQRMLLGMMWI